MPRGGNRPGGGRRPKTPEAHALAGWPSEQANREQRRQALAKSAERRANPPEVAQPVDLSAEQAALWAELAPFARAAGTLTPASRRAFQDLLEAITVKRAVLAQILAEGWMVEGKAHPLLARYQGLLLRVSSELVKFCLAPMGKPLEVGAPVGPVPEPMTDAFAEFDIAH